MSVKKYNVGEKAIVRDDLELGRYYGGHIYDWNNDKYKGREVVIMKINNSYSCDSYYDLDIDNREGYWTDEMLEPIEEKIKDNKETNKINNKKDGGNKMFNANSLLGKFGKIEDESVVLTLEGEIAVKRSEGEYVRYNKTTKTIENKMDLVLKEASDFLYLFPTDKIEVDDIILYKDTYCQIVDVKTNGELIAINIKNGSKKTMLKETNIIGLNLYYKVVSLFSQNRDNSVKNTTMNGIDQNMLMMMLLGKDDNSNMLPLILMQNMNNTGSKSNGINPVMLMLMSKNKEGDKKSEIKDLLMMQMLSGGNDNQNFNPMMLMAMSDGDMDMKTLMLMNMFSGNTINKDDKADTKVDE